MDIYIIVIVLYIIIYQKNKNRPDWDRIYEKSKALSRTSNPIKTPLLALPYGKPPLPSEYD